MKIHYFDTPILFLVFNRPGVTQQVFDQIKKIKPHFLYIAADGPRSGREDEIYNCLQTRAIIEQVDWDCELKTLFREDNLGCGVAVSSAITWFFDQVEYGIILEDDCLPVLSFFQYCEELLIKYKDDEFIMLIGGNNFQNGIQRGPGSYYFSYYPHIWGWASWRRAWNYYNYEMSDFEEVIADGKIEHVFQSKCEKKYWLNTFSQTQKKEKNTWDYQWVYSIWKNNGVVITPNCNIVLNLGFRDSSTHTFLRDSFKEINETTEIIFPLIHPEKIIDKVADKTTFNNVFGHNLKRLLRLFKENNILFILNYLLKR